MFDLGWTEFIVVAVVAILVVGPKELPGMLRTIGKTIGSARRMAGDFQRQFNDALKEADLDGIKSGIDSVNKINPVRQIKDSLNPIKQAADDVQRDNKGLLKSSEKAAPASTPAVSTDPVDTPAKPVAAKAAAKSKPATARATAKKPAAKKPAARKPAASKRSAGKTAAPAKAVAKPSATKQPARKTAAKSAAKSAKAPKKETDA